MHTEVLISAGGNKDACMDRYYWELFQGSCSGGHAKASSLMLHVNMRTVMYSLADIIPGTNSLCSAPVSSHVTAKISGCCWKGCAALQALWSGYHQLHGA